MPNASVPSISVVKRGTTEVDDEGRVSLSGWEFDFHGGPADFDEMVRIAMEVREGDNG